MTETDITAEIRLACSRGATRLFRNNSGKFQDANGRWVQFGIGSPGGADLIGWTIVNGVAVFTALEVKSGNRKPTEPQAAFLAAVSRAGGIAGIARSVEEAQAVIAGYRLRRQPR